MILGGSHLKDSDNDGKQICLQLHGKGVKQRVVCCLQHIKQVLQVTIWWGSECRPAEIDNSVGPGMDRQVLPAQVKPFLSDESRIFLALLYLHGHQWATEDIGQRIGGHLTAQGTMNEPLKDPTCRDARLRITLIDAE